MRQLFLSYLLLTISLISACGSNEPKTLASLRDEKSIKSTVKAPESKSPEKTLTHAEVREEYRQLLDLFDEQGLKEKIERRIADVYMMESEQTHSQSTNQNSYYSAAKQAYLDVLQKYPNSPDNAEVLYQLSKAYDIEGEHDKALDMLTRLTNNYPGYANSAEAYFRKGDIHFGNQEYRDAEKAYASVIRLNNQSLLLNAHYMLGWSRYKLFRHRESIDSFAFVLNQLLAEKSTIEELHKTERPLASDSISSLSLAIDKVGGAAEIDRIPALSQQPYLWMVYDNLGGFYLEKELYEESASAYRLFIDGNSLDAKASDFREEIIATYLKGGFNQKALSEKEIYVRDYGLNSEYTRVQQGISLKISANLKKYLDELASHYHSKGQLHQKQITDVEKKLAELPNKKDYYALYRDAIASFDKAADYYGQFTATFPIDERIDEIYFLRAETLFSAYRYPEAITDYKRVAYAPQGQSAESHLADAGYAAIVAHEKYIERLTTGKGYPGEKPLLALSSDDIQVKQWQESAVESMLAFATTFYADERSPVVLANAAEYLFALDQYQRAIDVSSQLLAVDTQLDVELQKTAYGIIAHSYFKLENYQQAENNYLQQRRLLVLGTDEYQQVTERLAASVYKKSENMIAEGDNTVAIEQLLRLKELAPDSPIRITAQYDAATLLLSDNRWSEAIVELLELQRLYPDHELAAEFPRKLAFAYEQNQSWAKAATAYLYLVDNDTDPELQRKALFLAASMYSKDSNHAAAVDQYKRYVAEYSRPFEDYVEAHYHLATNYESLNVIASRNQWLDAIIDVDQSAGQQRTERSRWLAAWANAKYGDFFADKFAQVTLLPPIIKTIPEKNQWLQNASARYQQAADYGILEFVAMSSFKIGVLYRQLAKELRNAPLPAGLSEGEQQAYRGIIDEQAMPFDQLAVELQQANIERAWQGQYNEWIGKSFSEMRVLYPERFDKTELIVSYGDGIR